MSKPITPRSTRVLMIVRALIAAVSAIVVTFVQNRPGEFASSALLGFLLATFLYFVAELIVRGASLSRVLLAAAYAAGGVLLLALPGTADARFHMALLFWAAAAGIIELVGGLISRRGGSDAARDQITVGVLTCILAIGALIVSPSYALDYFVADAGRSFTLTGTIVGVGLFGGWAAIVAVYLGIGAFSPTPANTVTKDAA